MTYQQIFGPVPSRRLGSSLGINNIPPKICTYACVYCQLGNAIGMTDQRGSFFDPAELAREAGRKLDQLRQDGNLPDYLTIVPDGEPTLDVNLGRLIELLKPLAVKIAVISNGSTINLPQVREALGKADWVSLKVDSLQEETWKRINRPHGKISLDKIKIGIEKFRGEFQGTLVTETMLVRDLNDSQENISEIARFLAQIQPAKSYLAVPTRPPAEKWVSPPSEGVLTQAFQIFQENGLGSELLIGYEGNAFASSGDLEADLLSITAVHPLREDAVAALVNKSGGDLSSLDRLIEEGKLAVAEYQDQRYYIRRFTGS